MIPALWDRVIVSPLNTRIVNEAGVYVSTIEHLMAALAGTGVTNAVVEIDGPEVPILDGSAAPWVRAILAAGRQGQGAPLEAIEILHPVEVRDGSGPLALGGPRQRAVLAMLVLAAPEVVTTDRIVDGLWGEQLPRGPLQTVQVFVHNLRKALGAYNAAVGSYTAKLLPMGQRLEALKVTDLRH